MTLKTTIIATILLTTSIAFADQWLLCDQPPFVPATIEAEITHNGTTQIVSVPYGDIDANEEVRILNLKDMEGGQYVFRIRFTDASGWLGEWSDELKAVKHGKNVVRVR